MFFLYIFQRMFLLGLPPRRSWLKAPALRRKGLLFVRPAFLRRLRWPAGLRLLTLLVLVSFENVAFLFKVELFVSCFLLIVP
jgi:hypothetical protein